MKVSRAVQVLSASVSVTLMALVYAKELPAAAMATAHFCERMDKVFDSLNSSSPKKNAQKCRYAIRRNDELVNFLRDQLAWIRSWKLCLLACANKAFAYVLCTYICSKNVTSTACQHTDMCVLHRV
uniref:Transposable element P transposase-like GTP-binding insertion domain-containing protein n=1 Tax=Rhipicephalus zambeziensis TaxID=60191 RepID=A0A224YVP6_9ACAR